MSGKDNWEFINKHVVCKCQKCGNNFYAFDIVISKFVSCDGLSKDVKCEKCGYMNEALKMRNYGLSDKKLRDRNDTLGDFNNEKIPWWTKRQPLWTLYDE